MKLLLVNGSPHKGNTWKLTQRVKEMLAVYDSAIEFQEVHLKIGRASCRERV